MIIAESLQLIKTCIQSFMTSCLINNETQPVAITALMETKQHNGLTHAYKSLLNFFKCIYKDESVEKDVSNNTCT